MMSTFLKSVNGRNVGMIQRREDLGLTLKSNEALRITRDRLWQNLDCDFAFQATVVCPVDFPHSAHAKG
jgi:hypothetical protein